MADVGQAYAVQQAVNARRASARSGRKIGLTSLAVQRQIGVSEPDYGSIFTDAAYSTGARIPMSKLLQPRVEAEVAFVLARNLDAEITLESVRNAIDYAVPAIEVVDSRVAGWDIRLEDTVADNASFGAYVLGSERKTLEELEPREVQMTMRVDGEVKSTGRGEDCLGDPLNAVLWLAETCARLGDPLQAGEVVLSGALGPVVPVMALTKVVVEIRGLGTVEAVFE